MPFDDPACFRLDRIPVRPIHRLWRPYRACAKLALLDGDPGAGKSLRTADLAARLTRGGRMPDGSWRRRKANVLFLNAEDALYDTRPPRLGAAGADLGQVNYLGGGLAAQRRTTPMRVRPTDPCRAPCRPYGLGWRRAADGTVDKIVAVNPATGYSLPGSRSGVSAPSDSPDTNELQ